MVPKLKGELPPPPPGADLRPAEPWDLCPTASTKEASIAADVRRGGGGDCRPKCSWAAETLAMSGATVSTSTNWPLASRGIRRPVETADVSLHTGPRRELAPGVVAKVRRPGVKRYLQAGRSVQGTN